MRPYPLVLGSSDESLGVHPGGDVYSHEQVGAEHCDEHRSADRFQQKLGDGKPAHLAFLLVQTSM